MNRQQLTGIARALVPALIAYIVGKGWLSQSSATDVSAAIIALLAAGWSVQTNSDASAIKTVTAMPDVKQIVVKAGAVDGAAQAAADPAQPKVVKAS